MLASNSYGHTYVNQQMQLPYINCKKSDLESHRDSKQEEDRVGEFEVIFSMVLSISESKIIE